VRGKSHHNYTYHTADNNSWGVKVAFPEPHTSRVSTTNWRDSNAGSDGSATISGVSFGSNDNDFDENDDEEEEEDDDEDCGFFDGTFFDDAFFDACVDVVFDALDTTPSFSPSHCSSMPIMSAL
tara:strand:+ start:505 stop:876 length:372 start_codon:yes stop_codon:yes gene_type:complete